jgi:hypothetical protein
VFRLPQPEEPGRDEPDSRALVRAWVALLGADGYDGDLNAAAEAMVRDELLLAAETVIDSASELIADGTIPHAVYADVVRRAIVKGCTGIARLRLDPRASVLN